jgi:hypothetical protein
LVFPELFSTIVFFTNRSQLERISEPVTSPWSFPNAFPCSEDDLYLDGVDAIRSYLRVPMGFPSKNLVALSMTKTTYTDVDAVFIAPLQL